MAPKTKGVRDTIRDLFRSTPPPEEAHPVFEEEDVELDTTEIKLEAVIAAGLISEHKYIPQSVIWMNEEQTHVLVKVRVWESDGTKRGAILKVPFSVLPSIQPDGGYKQIRIPNSALLEKPSTIPPAGPTTPPPYKK